MQPINIDGLRSSAIHICLKNGFEGEAEIIILIRHLDSNSEENIKTAVLKEGEELKMTAKSTPVWFSFKAHDSCKTYIVE